MYREAFAILVSYGKKIALHESYQIGSFKERIVETVMATFDARETLRCKLSPLGDSRVLLEVTSSLPGGGQKFFVPHIKGFRFGIGNQVSKCLPVHVR